MQYRVEVLVDDNEHRTYFVTASNEENALLLAGVELQGDLDIMDAEVTVEFIKIERL